MSESAQTKLIVPAVGGLYEGLSSLSYPIMRFFTGLFLVPHGAQKLFGWFGGNIDGTAGFFAKIGLEPALPLAYLVGFWEFFGGLAVALGFLCRPAAAGCVVLLLIAALNVHLGNGYFWNKGGYEYPLLWAILMFTIFIRGGGDKSVDKAIGKEF